MYYERLFSMLMLIVYDWLRELIRVNVLILWFYLLRD